MGWEKGGRNRGRETETESQKEREMSGREEEEEMRGVCGVLPFKGTRLSARAQTEAIQQVRILVCQASRGDRLFQVLKGWGQVCLGANNYCGGLKETVWGLGWFVSFCVQVAKETAYCI